MQVQNRDVRISQWQIGWQTANALIFGLENLLVLWLGARLVMGVGTSASVFTVGMLFAFLAYKVQFTGRVSKLIDYAFEWRMLGLHSERLADVALAAPEQDTPQGDLPPHDLAHLPATLELVGVGFRYSEGEPWMLRGVALTVQAGESMAITGPSGAGKTTLLKVLLGLLAPTEGEVRYGGQPIRHLGLANVRQHIGTVMQDDVLLTGSIADNIAFFDTQPDLERIQACAQLALLHEDVARMPMGYHTRVGDLGTGLSGGQKQRLLLARALYKKPKVLALDEATSHLDVAAEQAITRVLAQLPLTRLIIAHRPNTIAGAGRVVWLDGGALTAGASAAATAAAAP